MPALRLPRTAVATTLLFLALLPPEAMGQTAPGVQDGPDERRAMLGLAFARVYDDQWSNAIVDAMREGGLDATSPEQFDPWTGIGSPATSNPSIHRRQHEALVLSFVHPLRRVLQLRLGVVFREKPGQVAGLAYDDSDRSYSLWVTPSITTLTAGLAYDYKGYVSAGAGLAACLVDFDIKTYDPWRIDEGAEESSACLGAVLDLRLGYGRDSTVFFELGAQQFFTTPLSVGPLELYESDGSVFRTMPEASFSLRWFQLSIGGGIRL